MHALFEQLQNPLTRSRDERDRNRIRDTFRIAASCSHPHFLALRRYLDDRPHRFFSREVYETYIDWLQHRVVTDRPALQQYLTDNRAEIDRAILFLREINNAEWHDQLVHSGEDYERLRFVDKHVHPTYFRLIEGVLIPLTRCVAFFSRMDRGKQTDGLDTWSVVEELGGGPSDCLVSSYRHIIRNGLAHGGITFLQNDIRYRDKKGNEETLSDAEVIRLCDDLLDTCNGLAAALKVFHAVSRNRGFLPPREVLVEELQEETRAPWWRIEGCLESELPNSSQLVIYARLETRDESKVSFSTVQSGILAESFAPGFDRYFFSFRATKGWPGWAGFNGVKLRQLREANTTDLTKYAGVMEPDIIFFVPRSPIPKFLNRIGTFLAAFRVTRSAAMVRLREERGIPAIAARNGTVHRNGWRAVLRAEIVIEDFDDQSGVETIRAHHRRIVKCALQRARKSARMSLARFLPLGWAEVAVFRRDYRRRRLAGFGLAEDLVCVIRVPRIRRIKSPYILGSRVESIGRRRIAWNSAWLDDVGISADGRFLSRS